MNEPTDIEDSKSDSSVDSRTHLRSGKKDEISDAAGTAPLLGKEGGEAASENPRPPGANYYIHGKWRRYSPRSCGVFTLDSPFRQKVIAIIEARWFDPLILALIFWNSVMLALTDYSTIDPAQGYIPTARGKSVENLDVDSYSAANFWIESLEIIFTLSFLIECILKVIGMGFIRSKGSYLRDSWNWLDFIVVISSLLVFLPTNVSTLRILRVLRPLRSLTSLPKLKMLVSSLIASIPPLGNVMVILSFVFMIFGIFTVQIWAGSLHFRCRLTPAPIALPSGLVEVYRSMMTTEFVLGSTPESQAWVANFLSNRTAFPLCGVELEPSPDGKVTIGNKEREPSPSSLAFENKESSPWFSPKDCVWPLDYRDTRVCSDAYRQCTLEDGSTNTCGSNFDVFGNARFASEKIMQEATFIEDLNWGFTNFDSIPAAFMSIFQSITGEGWVDVMYQCQDATGPVAVVVFVLLIVWGSLFLLNLTLAVIWENFERPDVSSTAFSKEMRSVSLALSEATRSKNEIAVTKGPPLRRLIHHRFFQHFITTCIIINTVTLSMDKYPPDKDQEQTLELINFVLTCVFIVEMLLKLAGLGVKGYLRDNFNRFDAFIVVISVAEMFVFPPPILTGRVLLKTMVMTVSDIGNFLLLMFLFLFIFALIGMQLFANQMHWDEFGYPIPPGQPGYEACHSRGILYEGLCAETSRSNFDDIRWSLLTVFQVLSGENWNSVYYDARRVAGPAVAFVYFLLLINVGVFIVLNLVLAILLGNFEDSELIDLDAHKPNALGTSEAVLDLVRRSFDVEGRSFDVEEHSGSGKKGEEHSGSGKKGSQKNKVAPIMPSVTEEEKDSFELVRRETGEVEGVGDDGHMGGDEMLDNNHSLLQAASQDSTLMDALKDAQRHTRRIEQIKRLNLDKCQTCGRKSSRNCICLHDDSLWIFGPEHPFRVKLANIVHHPSFDNVILLLIGVGSVTLAIESPLGDPGPNAMTETLWWTNLVLTICFFFEMLFKIVVYGFALHKDSYIRNPWNQLDFFIVWISVVDLLSAGNPGLKALKTARILRGLRPLRMISRNAGMKLIVNAMLASIPSVMNVMLVVSLFFVIFAITSINYFKGKFYACAGEAFDNLSKPQLDLLVHPLPFADLSPESKDWFNGSYAGTTSRSVCEWVGASWEPVVPQDFNNFANAFFAFFELSTTEGWVDVMFAAIDATGVDMQPIRDHGPSFPIVFFCSFIVLGSFIMKNLFVGAVVDSFNEMKKELGGSALLTEAQQEWVDAQRIMRHAKLTPVLHPPQGDLRMKCFRLSTNRRFENFIMLCIVLNTFTMSLSHFGAPMVLDTFLKFVNYVFAFIFTGEAVVKLLGLGQKQYFRENWNMFDFVIVVGTGGGIILKLVFGLGVGSIASVARAFRIGRVFRLAKKARGLQQLFDTLILTLPSLVNIAFLLLLVILIYAIMGVSLFAKVAFGEALNEHAHFQTFGTATLTLIRALTGENWNGIMYDLANHSEGCVVDPPYDPTMCGFTDSPTCIPINGCGLPFGALVYFYSFTMLVTFVMLNVFIAVILENFNETAEGIGLGKEDVAKFIAIWKRFDPEAMHFLPYDDFSKLIRLLPRPMGIGITCTDRQYAFYERAIEAPVYYRNGVEGVSFTEAIQAIGKYAVIEKVKQRGEEFSEIPAVVIERAEGIPASPSLSKVEVSKLADAERTKFTSAQLRSVLIIQESYRRNVALKLAKKKLMEPLNKNGKKKATSDEKGP